MQRLTRACRPQLYLFLKRSSRPNVLSSTTRPALFFSTKSIIKETVASPTTTTTATTTTTTTTTSKEIDPTLLEFRQQLDRAAGANSGSTGSTGNNMIHQLWHQYEKVQGNPDLIPEDYRALRSILWKNKLWDSENRVLQVLNDMKKVGHEWTIGEYNEFFLVNLYQARYEDILATYKGETFTKSGLKLSIGSFNAILATYIKLGQEKEAAALIREAQERWGLIPDIRDFNRSMNRCMPRDTEVVTKGRDWIAQYGFDKVEVINTNLQHLFRDELVDEAVWIYDTLNKRNIPLELSTCTLLIKNLTDAKRLRLVSTIYDDMTQRGLKPNPSICGSMLSMYAHRRHEQKAENVVRDMVMAGHPMNEHIYNQLIKVYFKSRNLKKALQAFEEIHRHPKLQLNEVILNTMVDGLVINREIQAASVLYRQMLSTNSKIKPDMVTFNTLFKGFVKAKEFTLASGVIQDMYRYKCEPDTVTYTTLINSIFEYKQPRNTKELMGHVLGMGMTPNIYTFNAMINGWVRHQNMTEAEATLQLLQSSTYKLSPTIHTMTNLIQGYVETLNLPKAMETFQYAVSRGIKPDRAAYNFLITGFIDHDRFDDAVTCLRYMRQNNLNPNKDTWTMLMAQCVRKKLWKTGSILVKEMENSGFELWNPSLRRNYLILKNHS